MRKELGRKDRRKIKRQRMPNIATKKLFFDEIVDS